MAKCRNIQCPEQYKCLVDMYTGSPRCVRCSLWKMKLKGNMNNLVPNVNRGGSFCGTNNITYSSQLQMLKDACATGYVIEIKHFGRCRYEVPGTRLLSNSVLDEDGSSTQFF